MGKKSTGRRKDRRDPREGVMDIWKEIETMTREELLELVKSRGLFNQHDIRRAKSKVMVEKSRLMAEDAMAGMSKSHGIEKLKEYLGYSEMFDEAMLLSEKACEILKDRG
jgi:ERCC4-related helicase